MKITQTHVDEVLRLLDDDRPRKEVARMAGISVGNVGRIANGFRPGLHVHARKVASTAAGDSCRAGECGVCVRCRAQRYAAQHKGQSEADGPPREPHDPTPEEILALCAEIRRLCPRPLADFGPPPGEYEPKIYSLGIGQALAPLGEYPPLLA